MISGGRDDLLVDRPQVLERGALRLRRWGSWTAAVAGGIGLVVVAGYLSRTAGVVRLSGGLPPMYPNAALGLCFGAVAVLGSNRRGPWRVVALSGAIGIGTIGLVSLVLHVVGAGPTWFEGLFPDDFVEATTPIGGRPAPETCLAFVLLTIALTSLVLQRWSRLGQAFAVAGASVGISAVLGYLVGVDRSRLGGHLYVGMALHTGVGIALLGIAALCVRPNVGFIGQLLDGGVAGGVSRRVTAIVAATPVLLLVAGEALAGVVSDEALTQSIFSVLQVGVLSAAVLVPAAVMSRTERQLREELDAARRRDEAQGDIDTLVEAVTAEMTITAPELDDWEIGMRYQPATGHLAGDSVQVHVRHRPRPATLVALVDVAGHDVYSAVVAYGLRAHIGALWESGADLSTIVASANAKLFRRGTIATAVFVIFEPGAETIEVVNAGHPPPVHFRAGAMTEWQATGPLLGLRETRHTVIDVEILPDDLVVFYTDGVTEARSADGTELGEEFVHRLMVARQAESASTIADACVDAAIEHARSRLADDVLVIAARRLRMEP